MGLTCTATLTNSSQIYKTYFSCFSWWKEVGWSESFFFNKKKVSFPTVLMKNSYLTWQTSNTTVQEGLTTLLQEPLIILMIFFANITEKLAASIYHLISRVWAGQDLHRGWPASWAVHVPLHVAFSSACCFAWGCGRGLGGLVLLVNLCVNSFSEQ